MAKSRYRIVGTLTTTTPLCIRTGETWKDRVAALPRGRRSRSFRPGHPNFPLDNDVSLVVRDHQELPYIPASGLKGAIAPFLRRLIAADRALGNLKDRLGLSKEDCSDAIAVLLGEESRPSGGSESPKRGADGVPTDNAPSRTEANAEESGGRGGCVLFEDAYVLDSWLARHRRGEAPIALGGPWWNDRELTYIDTGVSIARRTKTAAEAMLLYAEAVPPGVPFRLSLTLDNENEAYARLLLVALKGFGLSPKSVPIQLGSDTSNGWGRLRWSLDSTEASIVRITPGNSLPWADLLDFGRGAESDPWPAPRLTYASEHGQAPRNQRTARETPTLLHLTACVELRFDGPFLVNDPSRCKGESEDKATSGDDDAVDDEDAEHPVGGVERAPDHYPRLTVDGRPLLPASGFRGPFRSQIERIIRTLVPEAPVGPHHRPGCKKLEEQQCDSIEHLVAESPLRRLLGTTGASSILWCSDFSEKAARSPNGPLIKRQEMVAIDRFTGGAAEHFKYDVAYIEGCLLEGELRADLDASPDSLALAGLLALALWDLCEGDITFGFGASKGFGECRAKIKNLQVLGAGGQVASAWNDLFGSHAGLASRTVNSDDDINTSWAEAVGGQGREDWDPALDKLLARLREEPRLKRWTRRETAKQTTLHLNPGVIR